MSTREELWTARLHDAVDDHPAAVEFDAGSYAVAGRRRVHRRRGAALVATVAAAFLVGSLAVNGLRDEALPPPVPAVSHVPLPGPGANGWVAIDAREGGDIYLVAPGERAHRLEVTGWETADDACPTWSPDGTRLVFGRLTGPTRTHARDAALVVVPVGRDGEAGVPRTIPLDGFGVLDGFEPHPCATWAPDGRWVALRGPGEVWVVDTATDAIRKLPDLRPIDLDWRPGTDQLAISGDMGPTRAADWTPTPVRLYSVSTGELRRLGAVEAGDITWSPDGATLAYTGGDPAAPQLRLVDASGADDRVLVADPGTAVQGIGPVWSPTGDRIAYQRTCCGSGEGSAVVLVDVRDGARTVLDPPQTPGVDSPGWYPWLVTWSPDGSTLLYVAWGSTGSGLEDAGVLAVPVDAPDRVTDLGFGRASVPGFTDHRWSTEHLWGRRPG